MFFANASSVASLLVSKKFVNLVRCKTMPNVIEFKLAQVMLD